MYFEQKRMSILHFYEHTNDQIRIPGALPRHQLGQKSLSGRNTECLSRLYAWFERLTNEGKIKGVRRLADEGKILSGEKAVTDGPFPESKEAIAGYWFIQADSFEEAVEIAKGNPCLKYGETVEVRPILPENSTLRMPQE